MNAKPVGEVCVDSGQLLICDPCYLSEMYGMTEELYDQICEATKGEDLCGPEVDTQMRNTDKQFPLGFATGTGYGAGRYRVFVKHVEDKDWGRRVAEIKIVFIGEEE